MIVSDQQWKKCGTLCEVKTVRMNFQPTRKQFFPLTSCAKHKKHDRLEPGLFKEKFFCTEMICLCSITFCCNYSQLNNFTFSSEKLRKRTLEDSGDGPISKCRKVLEEVIIVTSTNWGFRTIQHDVATYEQRRDCHTFIPRETFNKMECTLASLI